MVLGPNHTLFRDGGTDPFAALSGGNDLPLDRLSRSALSKVTEPADSLDTVRTLGASRFVDTSQLGPQAGAELGARLAELAGRAGASGPSEDIRLPTDRRVQADVHVALKGSFAAFQQVLTLHGPSGETPRAGGTSWSSMGEVLLTAGAVARSEKIALWLDAGGDPLSRDHYGFSTWVEKASVSSGGVPDLGRVVMAARDRLAGGDYWGGTGDALWAREMLGSRSESAKEFALERIRDAGDRAEWFQPFRGRAEALAQSSPLAARLIYAQLAPAQIFSNSESLTSGNTRTMERLLRVLESVLPSR
ncbi:MAG: hypothetical protein AAF658_08160 [Myxococcota bacterium]